MDNRTYLSLAGFDAIVGVLRDSYAPGAPQLDLIDHWTTFLLSPEIPRLSLRPNMFSVSNEGKIAPYVGSVSMTYRKRSLNNLVPYPLVYPVEWPTTFLRLASYFKATYGILLEEGEFTISGNTATTALKGTDIVNASPDASTGVVPLVASNTSIRFTAGSVLKVLPTAPFVAFALKDFALLQSVLNLRILTDHILPAPPSQM